MAARQLHLLAKTQADIAKVKPATKLPAVLPPNYVDIVRALPDQLLEIAFQTDRHAQRLQLRTAMGRCAFAFWIAKFRHPRARLDTLREKVAHARLAEAEDDLSEILWALEGAYRDDVVMGRKPGMSKNDGFEMILRDRAHVERYAEQMPGYQRSEPHPLAVKHFGPLVVDP